MIAVSSSFQRILIVILIIHHLLFLLAVLPALLPTILLLFSPPSTSSTSAAATSSSIMMASALSLSSSYSRTTKLSAASSSSSSSSSSSPARIAVIGAGAAGLAAARILSREGYIPMVLEKEEQGGGVWRYINNNMNENEIDNHADSKKKTKKKKKKDRPMYRGLRTNLPKEVMAFREFPFSKRINASFVTHQQVQEYLMEYQEHFGLRQYIHYGCQVEHLKVLRSSSSSSSSGDDPAWISRIAASVKQEFDKESWPAIQLDWTERSPSLSSSSESSSSTTTTTTEQGGQKHSQIFDAVLICNGHYAAPSTPHIPGLDEYFKNKRVMHSIEYDNPADFSGQTVLCIGGRASGADLAREISQYAKHVYLSDSSTVCHEAKVDGPVTLVPKTTHVEPNGEIRFQDCPMIHPNNVDTIIFCSGYDYSFPFLKEDDGSSSSSNLDIHVSPGERRVSPLFRQLWHAQYPSLAFVGLPHSIVPFPFFEFQIEAVCQQWKTCRLPPLAERLASAKKDAESGGPPQKDGTKKGRVPQDTHFLGDYQWDYCRDMVQWAAPAAVDGDDDDDDDDDALVLLEGYIRTNQEIYDHAGKARKSGTPGGHDSYRSIRYERPQWDQWKVVVVQQQQEEEGPSSQQQ